ncbi:sugar phosphate isomerase/epimerase family protein [Enterococcus durans]|uniref:Xylose isomerase-like TIM barrel domain-containing protein n=1 Tax=Enterococcus durans TaxID=53345 RepID=A0A367CHQ2_9ENTE|nr:TIM barrel protein [Enterococcus durans]RCA11203.1 hypothetical protein EA71_01958 [Enterococcus durans]
MSNIKSCVSLYSLQYEYMHGRMSLEDIFKYLYEIGVNGVEVLPDQMIHGAPHPSEAMISEWKSILKKYPMELACDDVFLNTNLYENRTLTQRECIDLIKQEIIQAKELGFKLIRLVSMTPPEIIEPVLPFAEENDIALAIELHAGLGFGVKETEKFLSEVERLDSPYVGIVVDAGLFCRRPPRVYTEYCKTVYDISDSVVKYIDDLFAKGEDYFRYSNNPTPEFKEEIEKVVEKPDDRIYLHLAEGYENLPLSVMDPYMKYIKHFHFKLYEMVDGEEFSIDYPELIQYLHDHDYEGFVATEYEGNRWVLPGHPMVEKEQVLEHQKFIKKLIENVQG